MLDLDALKNQGLRTLMHDGVWRRDIAESVFLELIEEARMSRIHTKSSSCECDMDYPEWTCKMCHIRLLNRKKK